MSSIHLLLPIYFILTSCSLFNPNKNDDFNTVFKAEINGELMDISTFDKDLITISAGLSTANDITFLRISGNFYDEAYYPYREIIGVSVPWSGSSEIHTLDSDTVYYNQNFYWIKRGMYFEADGDVSISSFYSTKDDQGVITVNIETLNDGRDVVFGNFEFSVVTSEPLNQFSQRIGQDTLHITNGEYRLLLDDRRME